MNKIQDLEQSFQIYTGLEEHRMHRKMQITLQINFNKAVQVKL